MNTDPDFDLLLAYLYDELDDDEVGALVQRLQDEPRLAERLVVLACEEGKIVEWAGATSGLAPMVDAAPVRQPGSRRRSLRVAAQLAAVVLVSASAIGIAAWLAGRGSSPNTPLSETQRPSFDVRLVKATACKWADNRAAMPVGSRLDSGSVLELVEGLAEIQYSSGVHVTLQGPATFELSSAEAGTLHAGQLVATVPRPGSGFVVRTPSLAIVDRGTQFGVRVNDDGKTEVHVFQGEVETRTQGTPAVPKEDQLLTTTQAAKFDAAGRLVDWIEPDYAGFAGVERLAPGVVSTSRAVRWLPHPPPSLEADALQSNSSVFLLLERQNVVLDRDILITSVQRSGTQAHFSIEENMLPAGTRVDSYLMHFDPSVSPQSGRGEVHFERPILGIIAREDHLLATDDILGVPGTSYERSGTGHRGLDDGTEDHQPDVIDYMRSTDRLKVVFGTQNGTSDQVRVLVAAED